ncbi:MAG: hypothetical protein H6719_29405 [Sandaracinaceae bacterium]|nr:hypothetical protein [Sandaracinaceae bacterium]
MSQLPPQLESLLVEHIAVRKRTHLKTAIFMPLFFLPLGALTFFVLDPPERNLWVMCVGAGLLGLLFLIPALGDPKQAKPLQLLRERRQDIVWMYPLVVRNKATSWILLRTSDGGVVRLPAKFGSEEALLEALAAFVPSATAGFSPELEARYRSDPSSLRRPAAP